MYLGELLNHVFEYETYTVYSLSNNPAARVYMRKRYYYLMMLCSHNNALLVRRIS